jgi:hypothetical protein
MRRLFVLTAVLLLGACKKKPEPARVAEWNPAPPHGSRDWKIENARSAAPPLVSVGARVMEWPSDSLTAQEVVAGIGGWTCIPDDPDTPVEDPVCRDDQSLSWYQALRGHRPPVLTGMGVAYRLHGGNTASDTDPYQVAPDSGEWIVDPPSIEIAISADHSDRIYKDLPTTRTTSGPWIKWARTPYAIIVLPVTTR